LVSIIIPTVGAKDYLSHCLDSIRAQTYPKIEVIVIDNSLNQTLRRRLSASYPEVKIYPNQENLFYCQALNLGIGISRGDFILCLNDDVILEKNFIEKALKGFGQDACVGMVSGKILRSDMRTIDSAGLFLSIWRTAKERGYGFKDRGQYDSAGYAFGPSGAAAFYRRQMLEEVKVNGEYFDSDFRFFYEDLDVAWRANRLGWRCYYAPSAVAYHVRGGTARKEQGIGKPCARHYLSDELRFDLIKNRYLAAIKNETIPGFLFSLPFMFIYDLFAWGYVLLFRPAVIKKFFLHPAPLGAAFRKRSLCRSLAKRAKPIHYP
jgi:GT2 family glycosyltransferase